jgi:Zn-dependent protease
MDDSQTEIERKLEQQQLAAQASELQAPPQSSMAPEQVSVSNTDQSPYPAQPKKNKGGILGLLGAIGLFIMKMIGPILFFLAKIKFILISLVTMVGSMWIYSLHSGWKFGVGIVLLIFIHESGHAIANRIKGLKVGPMVFIPFMGAAVFTQGGRTLEEDAYIGIMGPIFGTVSSIVCFALAFCFHDMFFISLAYFGFMINLFNLMPFPPLDGGWITPLFSPKLLAIGAVLAIPVGFLNPFIWLLALASLPRIKSGWKADPKTQPYYQVSTSTKWEYGILYVGLAILLAIGMFVSEGIIKGI